MSYVVVGLGNPGKEYENTRHNTGAFFVEIFRRLAGFPEWKEDKERKLLVSEGKIKGKKVLLVLPQTFMNKSGEAMGRIKALRFKVKNKKREADNLTVVHDDLDLPLGRFKISFNKSAGGHRGVLSVSKAVRTDAFTRVRVGISPPFVRPGRSSAGGFAVAGGKPKKPAGEKAVIDHILGEFKPAELAVLKKLSKKVNEAIQTIVVAGRDKAMNIYNSL